MEPQREIPSPLPLLLSIPDPRNPQRIEHSWEALWKLVLLSLCGGCTNILAMIEWMEDQKEMLIKTVGIKSMKGEARLPSQATIYRFMWAVDKSIEAVEQQMTAWAKDVYAVCETEAEGEGKGGDEAEGYISVAIDGKHLLDTARPRAGEKGLVMCAAYLHKIGLTLVQKAVLIEESQTAKEIIATLKEQLPAGEWVATGDAGLAKRPLAQAIQEAQGHYLLQIKRNQADLFEMAQWMTSTYPPTSTYQTDEYRSGEYWSWQLSTYPIAQEHLATPFPGLTQLLHMQRKVIALNTGEIRTEQAFSLTDLELEAKSLYPFWRGHWSIENRLHHKRDTVFREDNCRTRLAAQTLAALRNAILGWLHASGQKVLRSIRKFHIHPNLALPFIGLPTCTQS